MAALFTFFSQNEYWILCFYLLINIQLMNQVKRIYIPLPDENVRKLLLKNQLKGRAYSLPSKHKMPVSITLLYIYTIDLLSNLNA